MNKGALLRYGSQLHVDPTLGLLTAIEFVTTNIINLLDLLTVA